MKTMGVPMQMGTNRRAGRELGAKRWVGAAAALILALAGAGCTTDGTSPLTPTASHGATIAFESIDGPPVSVFHKLVSNLAAEALTRQVAVVSRASEANYRVRGYLAAYVEDGRAHIDWVWDIYDGDKHRALRIAGAEPAGRRKADIWAAADDELLHRIAQASMEQLAAFLADPAARPKDAPAQPPSPPDRDDIPVAAADPDPDHLGQEPVSALALAQTR